MVPVFPAYLTVITYRGLTLFLLLFNIWLVLPSWCLCVCSVEVWSTDGESERARGFILNRRAMTTFQRVRISCVLQTGNTKALARTSSVRVRAKMSKSRTNTISSSFGSHLGSLIFYLQQSRQVYVLLMLEIAFLDLITWYLRLGKTC